MHQAFQNGFLSVTSDKGRTESLLTEEFSLYIVEGGDPVMVRFDGLVMVAGCVYATVVDRGLSKKRQMTIEERKRVPDDSFFPLHGEKNVVCAEREWVCISISWEGFPVTHSNTLRKGE